MTIPSFAILPGPYDIFGTLEIPGFVPTAFRRLLTSPSALCP